MTHLTAEISSDIDTQILADSEHQDRVLASAARAFVSELAARFEPERQKLLAARQHRQSQYDSGQLPDFPEETSDIRQQSWKVAQLPGELQDRRVEITGPVERKMIINALNSGARVFMADFEDSSSPTWDNMIDGQNHLMDAVRGTIEFTNPAGRQYALKEDPAILMVRPRGLHLDDRHWTVTGVPISGSLMDAGLFLFHNARELIERGHGPYLYLPKLEHYQEARWWDQVLCYCEDRLEIPRGAIKTTVLIETLPAVFQMDEILYQLRDRAVGLNCGRWDYIFSYIKTLRNHPDRVLPDRAQVGMTVEFLSNYSRQLIRTCHRRGVLAMGGMAAQIPVKGDDQANQSAFEAVRADKLREAGNGHDGTWVAHPGLIPLAMEVFDQAMPTANQVQRIPPGEPCTREDLLLTPAGTRTEQGGRGNVDVAIRYLANWLCGRGCVPIHHLMEDAATAEIARSQLWQWVRHGACLEDGSVIDRPRVRGWIDHALTQIEQELGAKHFLSGRYGEAAELLQQLVCAPELTDFLTLLAYSLLEDRQS